MNRSATRRIVMAWLARQAANVDLTWDDALVTLGFQSGASPSKSEVQSAWRQLARKHHPDLGGDMDKMVELNAAKDILDGVRAPSRGYARSAPPRPSQAPPRPSPRPSPRPDQEPPRPKTVPKTVVTIGEAIGKVNIPSDVKWVFLTEQVWSSKNGSDNEVQKQEFGNVAYGVSSNQHFFLLMVHTYNTYTDPATPDEDLWRAKVYASKLALDPDTSAASIQKGLASILASASLTKPANPRVASISQVWDFSKGLPLLAKRGRSMSQSDFLAGADSQEPPKAEKSYYQPPKGETVTFEQALASVTLPPNISWILRTADVDAPGNYSGDESSKYTYGFVACGTSGSNVVYVTCKHEIVNNIMGGKDSRIWSLSVSTTPMKKGVISPTDVTKGLKAALQWHNLTKPDNPTIYALPAIWTPTERIYGLGNYVSLEDIFINLGVKKAPKTAPKIKMYLAREYNFNTWTIYQGYGLILGTNFYALDVKLAIEYRSLLHTSIDKNNYPNNDGYYLKEFNRSKSKVGLAELFLRAVDENLMSPKLPSNMIAALQAIVDG